MKEITPRITIDPEIQGGRPVIKGTKVPVDLVLGKIAGGMISKELIKKYVLKREDIFAAINYEAKSNKKYAKTK